MPSNLSQVYCGILKSRHWNGRLASDLRRWSRIDLYGNIPNELAHQRVIVNGKRSKFGVGMEMAINVVHPNQQQHID